MENLKKFIDEVKGEQERTNEELIEELEDIILGIQRFLYIENDEFKDISDIVESDFLIDTWIYEYAEKVLQLNKKLVEHYKEYLLGHWEVDVPHYAYLPTKVVFNEKLKRTTLIFGNPNKPFDVVRSEAKNEYNEYLGFLIGMVKYLYKVEAKRHIDYGYKRYNKFKNNISNYLEQIIRQEIKLSDYQLEKLFDNITKKDNLKFNVNGKIHEIAIKRKEK